MDIKAYLDRIGMDGAPALSYAFLKELQQKHITAVPYENLDILNGLPLSLDAESLYRKIVTNHRGGYCFELNGALAALLREIGFEVTEYMARFLKGETSIPVRRHRVVAVKCEGRTYIVEVGIGQYAPRVPLLLETEVIQNDGFTDYRFERDPFFGWVLQEYKDGEWKPYYAFTEEIQLEIDFIQPSFYCEKHPDSPFWKAEMVAIKTPTGRKAINGRDFKVFEGDVLTSLEEGVFEERLLEILRTEFGIEWKSL